MQAEPLGQLNWMMFLFFFLFAAIMAGFTLKASRQTRREATRTVKRCLGIGALLGAVLLAMLVFSGFHGQTFFSSTLPEPPRVVGFPVPPKPMVSVSSSLAEVAASKTAELGSIKNELELPEWTRLPMRIDGSRKLIVVSSGRFASEEEAVLHGFQQAAANVAKEYASLDPRGIGAVQLQHADLIKDTAIKQRFLEVTQHDFGKFHAPMHQLWLQVELTPELGERLAEPWRQAAVDARLRTLTGWSLWGTAAAALAAFALRLDAAWNGRRRAMVAGTAIALTLGSLAFLA